MLKLVLFGVLFMVLLVGNAQDNGRIPYAKDMAFTWEMFKGAPEAGPYHAVTDWGIELGLNWSGGVVQVEIQTFFLSQTSWRIKEKERPDLLIHERLHLDIAELAARRIRKRVSKLKVAQETMEKAIREIYNEEISACKKKQRKFDEETDHSVRKGEQIKWYKSITADLKRTIKWELPSVQIELK